MAIPTPLLLKYQFVVFENRRSRIFRWFIIIFPPQNGQFLGVHQGFFTSPRPGSPDAGRAVGVVLSPLRTERPEPRLRDVGDAPAGPDQLGFVGQQLWGR